MSNADMPAMPQSGDNIEQWHDPTNPKAGTYFATGLTKLEDFTKAAMQGFISAGGMGMPNPSELSELAVKYAEAVLYALDKGRG
tara:strand:- start:242 stop:493 length:252 start_codon:yes stop_codon:yes gene_type:complete